ncbi:MFS transporter [Brevibacillus centrosporus]|uniref:MFS transporter n=1 Tax=Brevibacillus centrosporus TaxID=54910 RepID=UPI002E231C6F|nr:MFS transporter [Brevibacillus centrosporus]MED1954179.1 MFS transporter [Brevibacillus centrosporus]
MNDLQREDIQKRVAKCMPWILLFEFFYTFNDNVFNLITPNLSEEFGVTPSTISLIVTFSKLFFGIAAIIYTALSDIISIRKVMLFTCVIFPIATLLGVFSQDSFTLLVISRVLFAVTIAAPVALQIIIAIKYFDKLTAAKYLGYNTAIYQLASAAGHLFGGYITEYLHWNLVFLIPLLTIFGLPVLFKNLPKEVMKKGSFDVVGMILMTAISACLITFLTFKMKYPLFLAGAAVCAALFVWHTLKSKNPFLKPELFKIKGITRSLIVGVLFYATQIGFYFIFPFIVKETYGMSTSTIGAFYTITNIAAFIIGMFTGSIIKKIGYRNIALLGGTFIFAGLAMIAFFVGFSVVFSFLGMGLFNIGYVLFFSGYLTNFTQLLPKHQQGAGIGVEKLVVTIAASLGGAFVAMLYGQPYMMTKIVDFSSNAQTALFSNVSLVLMIMIGLATWLFVSVFGKNFNREEEFSREESSQTVQ